MFFLDVEEFYTTIRRNKNRILLFSRKEDIYMVVLNNPNGKKTERVSTVQCCSGIGSVVVLM